MFENSSNNQSNQSVDDIFAETDQVAGNNPAHDQSGIVARKVGLASGNLSADPEEKEKKKKGFFITVIIMVVIVVGLLAFLAYGKFWKPDNESLELVQAPNQSATPNVVADDPSAINQGANNADSSLLTEDEAVVPIGGGSLLEEVPEDNLLNPEEVFTTPIEPRVIDSDGDGLSDEEELIYRTNINLIDSDNDGLPDYEEVMIYKTDPLNSDTDGDGHLDGTEVKHGYNPLGIGVLPGNENR